MSTTPQTAPGMPTPRFKINFMAVRKAIGIFSILCILASMVSLVVRELHYGLDFTGGVIVELEYQDAVDMDAARNTLRSQGFEGAVVVPYGSVRNVLVRLPPQKTDADFSKRIVDALGGSGKLEVKRTDIVGAQVGDELRGQAVLAVLVAMFAVLVYVTIRFEKKFAIGAVAALFHDVIVILGVFSLMGWDFDLTVLAAILAIIGYSLNDSIVVADRVRENFRKFRDMTADQLVDFSINQTLDRTILTSLTTWLVVLALFVLGGEALRGFSVALLIGIFVGTYSSIYVAANVALMMNVTREDYLPPIENKDDFSDYTADLP